MRRSTDELAFVGADAEPRPEVIEAARAALVNSEQESAAKSGFDDHEVWQIGRAMFRRATGLRKSGKSEDAVALYFDALVRFESLDVGGEVSACLTGAGLAYLELAKASLRDDLSSGLQEHLAHGGLTSIFSLARRSITGDTLDFAKKSRLCHLWALEVQKELRSLGGQAGRIANLAITEHLLGNVDTARRYVVWALDVHRAAHDSHAVSIDLTLLTDIERSLGDEKAAAELEREAADPSGAPSV